MKKIQGGDGNNNCHKMCRALNKQILFDEEEDFLFYLKLMSENKEKYQLKIYWYCLMINHVHMLLYDKK